MVIERIKAQAVVQLHLAKYSQGQIFNLLKNTSINKMFICCTIKRFEQVQTTQDCPRSGHPKTITTPRVKKLLSACLKRNLQQPLQKVSSQVKINRESMRQVVKRELRMSPFKRRYCHFISPHVSQKRLARLKHLLRWLETSDLNNWLFTNEKIFSIDEKVNGQNDRIWSTSSSSIDPDIKNV